MKKKIIASVVMMIMVFSANIWFLPQICSAKTSWVAVYKMSGKKISYKNTKIVYESGNSLPAGKKRSIKLANNAKFYWFYFAESDLEYKKMSGKKFKKKFKGESKLLGYQICKIIIKNGKVTKIYGEYQA